MVFPQQHDVLIWYVITSYSIHYTKLYEVNSIEKVKENVENAVEVATIQDRKNKFHYKFFENKLYLLGNFDEMPYEIIELNSKSGKSYFLFYDDSFYKLKSDQLKPAPLVKIENDSLVNELKIILV